MRDVCLDCFKPPASRSRAYCDCNPIRAFETFDISREPISKTSRFWMFWYKRGCNWLGAIKGMALWSRGFSRGSLFKTWPKPETAHEKPLAPRIHRRHFAGKPVVALVNVGRFLRLSFLSKCHMTMMRCTSYLQHAQNKQLPYMTYPLPEMCSFPLYLTSMKGKPRVADLTENFTF